MRIAVISDVHSNPWALQAVIEHALKHGVEAFWSVGDLIGYGPAPVECLDLAGQCGTSRATFGNHEDMRRSLDRLTVTSAGELPAISISEETVASTAGEIYHQRWGEGTRQSAIHAMLLNMLELRASNQEPHPLLEGPTIDTFQAGKIKIFLTHAGVNSPLRHYIYPWSSCDFFMTNAVFDHLDQAPAIAFLGHSHVPSLFVANGSGPERKEFRYGEPNVLTMPHASVGVGSVGQPRDLDPRACYVILELDLTGAALPQVTFYRVAYAVNRLLAMMGKKKYPNDLIRDFSTASHGSEISQLEKDRLLKMAALPGE